MGTEAMELVERMRGRKLSSEEKDMFIRMKDELGCADDDAVWQMVAVMECQKTFYLDLPEKITAHTEKLLRGITSTVETELAIAQSKLLESVRGEAQRLRFKTGAAMLLLMGSGCMAIFFLFCSLMMWAGYRLGAGGNQPPPFLLRIPSGFIIGILIAGCAAVCGYWTIKKYVDERKISWRPFAGFVMAAILAVLFMGASI